MTQQPTISVQQTELQSAVPAVQADPAPEIIWLGSVLKITRGDQSQYTDSPNTWSSLKVSSFRYTELE